MNKTRIGAVVAVVGLAMLMLGLATLAPVGAQEGCVGIPPTILINPPVLTVFSDETYTVTRNTRSIAWNVAEEVIDINLDVAYETGGAATTLVIGGVLQQNETVTEHWTWEGALESKYYDEYVQVVTATTAPGVTVHPSTTIGDVIADVEDHLVTGVYSWTLHGDDPGAPGAFRLQFAQAAGQDAFALQAQWKVTMHDWGCAFPPAPTPVPTGTPWVLPTPTVDPANIDIYNLDGDYGAVGRLFDFGVILAVARALIEFVGVDNLRDWVALGAALAVLVAVVSGATTSVSNTTQS